MDLKNNEGPVNLKWSIVDTALCYENGSILFILQYTNTLITKKFGRKNFGRGIFGRFFSKFRIISDKISDKISDSYIQKPAKFRQKMWK